MQYYKQDGYKEPSREFFFSKTFFCHILSRILLYFHLPLHENISLVVEEQGQFHFTFRVHDPTIWLNLIAADVFMLGLTFYDTLLRSPCFYIIKDYQNLHLKLWTKYN